ncbi:DUF4145 domain-containing protein [Roseomonas sp. BN140053]|uniref:DUF4145 domain-containing protein n=1 Tax=Roseomonas sp. BN140053 TaxID=3391898 RepID=UPI0039EC74FA
MPATFSAHCPFCGTEASGFNVVAAKQKEKGHNIFNALMVCGNCDAGVVALVQGASILNWIGANSHKSDARLVRYWPEPEEPSLPKFLPENVKRAFAQAQDNILRRHWEAAGIMFRKSLENGLKLLHPEGKGTLQRRIENLPIETGVTPTMREWADEIRSLGNDAAHEETEFTEAEAKALQAFTEVFLTYAFTLPGQLKARKAEQPPPT